MLADSLTHLVGELGAKDQLVQKILAGKSPARTAVELISGNQGEGCRTRKKVYEGALPQ